MNYLWEHLDLLQEAKTTVNKRTGQKGRWVMIHGHPVFLRDNRVKKGPNKLLGKTEEKATKHIATRNIARSAVASSPLGAVIGAGIASGSQSGGVLAAAASAGAVIGAGIGAGITAINQNRTHKYERKYPFPQNIIARQHKLDAMMMPHLYDPEKRK